MKIGILTYHRAHNFGALLQAMATRFAMEKMGHEAYYVDYWPEYHKKRYLLKEMSFLSVFRHPKRYFKFLRSKSNRLARITCFETFINTYIAPFCKSTSEHYDVVLYGSDQIWRKVRELDNFDSVYFGSNCVNSEIKISFAASTHKLPDPRDSEDFKQLLKNFDAISVREENLQNYCEELGFKTERLIDPTFLLNKEEWVNYLNIKKTNDHPYVLYYIMKQGVFDISIIKDFCRRKKLNLKILHGYNIDKDDEENISIANPIDMVSLIYNAEFVITTSFHGLAFAILMRKNFVVSTDFGVDRINSLLNEFGLADRFVNGKESIPDLPSVEFSKIVERQNRLRDQISDFLLNYINAN